MTENISTPLLKNLLKTACNFLQLNTEKPKVMILGPDIASEQNFSDHYPLMSPFISSERMAKCVLVHDSVIKAPESATTEGERAAFSVRTHIE